jgi:hypothetical protein
VPAIRAVQRMKSKPPPKVCPVCGEDVPPKALACPECGSCHKTGWKEDADVQDGLDLPDEEFDYDEYVQREFGGGGANRTPAMNPIWWITALVLVLILLAALLGRGH